AETAELDRALATAESVPRSDLYARGARGDVYSERAFLAASDGRWDDAIAAVAGHLEVHAPDRCVVAVALDDERKLAVVRDEAGHAFGELGRRQTVIPPPAELVPDALRARVKGCAELHVLALPPLNGRPDLLPAELAWSYGAGTPSPSVASAAPPRRLIVTEVTPPPSLTLPPLQPYTAPPDRPAGLDRVLRGGQATPARVLGELPDADEIELDVHGFIDLGVSDASMLVLSTDAKGRWALTANDLKQLHLTRAPLVILGACNAATRAPAMHDAWSLPQAFVIAGARAVFGSAAPIPDVASDRFFNDVQSRIHAGATPAIALRDARMQALRDPHGAWTRDVMLFQ
ncbi:MAG TPA: CHAT domain-containing protein, partial [Polyangia bacterium]|nr:CHAT domain-containing protein [Polyangia bacterium]